MKYVRHKKEICFSTISPLLTLVLLLILNPGYAFDAGLLELSRLRQEDGDTTHYEITVCALCRVTIDYLKSAYQIDTTLLEAKFNEKNGQCNGNIVNDIDNILSSSQQKGINPWQFATMVKSVASANTKTDLKEVIKEDSHFDSERFQGGSQLVLTRYQAAVNSIQNAGNHDQARRIFGEMLHMLQDFYSHTNYIELDYKTPSEVLGRRVFRTDEYASVEMRTCISCQGRECQTKSNLDETLVRKKLLTSGYFIPIGLSLFTRKKPKGKCSHGGAFDSTQNDEPVGGINKDKLSSIHGHLHYQAGNMAYRATVDILTKFRNDIGNDDFGLFLSLKTNLNSLVISIDTSCSMADYVDLAKQISINIVNQSRQLEFAPHNYILVSFNSERAQLVINTRDPRALTDAIHKLNSCEKGNSTAGEMYYSSLVEGLKPCEYASAVYTFTDSPARDAYLKHQALALIRNKRAVIYSFMGQQMQRRAFRAQSDVIDLLDGSDGNIDLAWISGGLTYPITVADKSVISEFVLRRLEWTRLQSISMFKSSANSASISFNVDSSIDELQLDISSMSEIANINGVVLRKPDTSQYVLTTNYQHTKYLHMWKITKPDVGTWSLTTPKLSPTDHHNVQIQGKTSLVCSSVLHKQMENNTDTSGYTQLNAEPIIGSDLFILTTCENLPFRSATISLIDPSDRILSTYSSVETNQLGTLTKIRVPQQQFRIQTVLTLTDGRKMQRLEKQLISPTTISIELTNQPFLLSLGETIEMNYTIKSTSPDRITVRLQILDTLKLSGDGGIEKDLTFANEIFGTEKMTLPKKYQQKSSTDLVTFAVSTRNNQTKNFVLENDETVAVYFELNSASITRPIIHFVIGLLCFFVHN